MGASESACAQLLDQLGWKRPEFVGEFYNSNLASYLQSQNLEVVLPRHAPQCDISMADRKPKMYPRPSFCWEAYKMHVAILGPSTACRNQITSFLPKIADVFQGPASRLGPGREAVPYYFLDEELHRLVLWELPEITYRQSCEDYIRELGLLYIDCVFMLFSDKYVVTDIYSKLCVAMAIHGVPFFVLCTMSGEELDEMSWRRLQADFQKKDIRVRMFNPMRPQDLLGELINDFFKEVAWNRSSKDADLTKNVSENILGQTVRLKNIEKKPELNGRCGVCIGFDKEHCRYRVRMINAGVETDIALKEDCLSILKPKLVRAMVRLKGLESKPELNGRFAFVDEFLRDSERYRVFVPDRPGNVMVLALKSANLERVESVKGAEPISCILSPDAKPMPPPKPKPATGKPLQEAVHAAPGNRCTAAPAQPQSQRSGGSTGSEEKPRSAAPAQAAAVAAAVPPARPKAAAAALPPAGGGAEAQDDDLASLLPKREFQDETPSDLMSRILIKSADNERHGDEAGEEDPGLQLSRAGLLAQRVWAVVGNTESAEDIVDHLMDCGKTVFCIGEGDGAHFPTIADLDSLTSLREPKLPDIEVLAFLSGDGMAVEAAIDDARRLGIRGILLHPEAGAYGPTVLPRCRDVCLPVHGADILEDVVPGPVLAVAPID